MSQEELNRIFTESERARAKGLLLDNGWGSNQHCDKDTLVDGNTGTQWERDRPDGEWRAVPGLGRR